MPGFLAHDSATVPESLRFVKEAERLEEERDTLGPTPLSEVLEAQQEILTMVRDLMDKGEVGTTVGEEQMV